MSRVRRIAALALAVLAAAPAAPPQERRAPFEKRHIVAHGRRIDTQFYDFTGDGVLDALLVSIDFDADPPARWVALHVGTKGGGIPEKPDQIWSVAPSTCALALGNVVPEGGVDILEIAPDGVGYHAFENGRMTEELRKLLHTRTFFTTASTRSLPTWSTPVDLSNDRLDDLVIPIPDGYKVYFQTEPGRFGVVARIDAEVAAGQGSISPTRFAADWERLVARSMPATSGYFNLHDELPRLSPVDLDGDGDKELVSIVGNRMTIFFQSQSMRFPATSRTVSQIGALGGEQKKDAVSVSDVQFCDIDGDGIMDFIVTRIGGQLGLLESINTRIYPHMGTGRKNFKADSCIFIDGISLSPTFIDMDGDGGLDVMTSRLRTDVLAKGLEKAIMGDITVTYEVFQFDRKTRAYSTEPVFSRDVRIRFDDISKRGAASRPLFQVAGDLSGDKRPDAVLYNPKTSVLEVRRGRPVWERGGGRQIIDFELDVAAAFDIEKEIGKDRDPKWLSYLDIDGDGRQDIILNYASQLIILLSRF